MPTQADWTAFVFVGLFYNMYENITQSFLKEIFHYENGKFYWKVVLSRHGKIGKEVGCDNGKGYLKVGINKKYYAIHKLMFLYHFGYIPKIVDHIDRNPLNNMPNNLRDVTASQNSFNRGIRSNNKSSFKGVSFNKKAKGWRSEIQVNGKQIYLGVFKTKELAAIKYNEAAIKYFKEFAFINKI